MLFGIHLSKHEHEHVRPHRTKQDNTNNLSISFAIEKRAVQVGLDTAYEYAMHNEHYCLCTSHGAWRPVAVRQIRCIIFGKRTMQILT